MEEIEGTVFRNHLPQLQNEKWFGEKVFPGRRKKDMPAKSQDSISG